MTASEPEFDKPFHEKVFHFLGDDGPLIGTVYAPRCGCGLYSKWPSGLTIS